jgi:N-acetylglutamate synthase
VLPPDPARRRAPTASPDAFALERAAARAWPAATTEARDGWLLRSTPAVPHRRNNSALPLTPAPRIAAVEEFFGGDALVAVAPLEDLAALDAELERRGWPAEGATDVLVARAEALRPPSPDGVEAVDPAAWPNEVIREEVLSRARDEVFAFADGQRGAVLCIRTGDLAGIFRLHVAPGARRQGVGRRLVAACAGIAPVLYAQVEADNAPAQRLFAGAGFARSHGYHYRRRP